MFASFAAHTIVTSGQIEFYFAAETFLKTYVEVSLEKERATTKLYEFCFDA
jgi:hypothetical protein